MSRRVDLVILCEDTQHEFFVRHLAERLLGKRIRVSRVEKPRRGEESGEAYVRRMLPVELRALTKRTGQSAVVAVTDDDTRGRLGQLREACARAGVTFFRPQDGFLLLVPARNIETWFAYLDGKTVDEVASYPRLSRAGDCQRHVNVLADLCDRGALREPAPPSLEQACDDFAPFRQAVKAALSLAR